MVQKDRAINMPTYLHSSGTTFESGFVGEFLSHTVHSNLPDVIEKQQRNVYLRGVPTC